MNYQDEETKKPNKAPNSSNKDNLDFESLQQSLLNDDGEFDYEKLRQREKKGI